MYVATVHNVEGGNLLKKPSCANKKLGELKKIVTADPTEP